MFIIFIALLPALTCFRETASVVCQSQQTGTLTQNVMSVVAGSIGIHAKFIRNLEENKAHTNTPDQEQDQPLRKGHHPSRGRTASEPKPRG